MAPVLSVWKQTAAGDLGTSRGTIKTRVGSKWLESIQAELDEIDIVLGKEAKAGTNGGLQSTLDAVSSVYRRNGKRSPSPKVRRLAKKSSFTNDPDVFSRSQSPDRHASVQSESLGSQNSKPKHPNQGRGALIRQALAVSDMRQQETNQSSDVILKTSGSRSSSLRRLERSNKNFQIALFEEHDRLSDAEKAFRELVEIKKKFKQTLLGHLRDSSLEPIARYPSSLSPKRGRCLGRLGNVESSTQGKGANWGSLTESQRPAPSPRSVSQSAVPLYPTQDAWKSIHERSASSVWSRNQTLRTGPEQWRESTLNGVPWRLDGRKPSICRTRSSSRSKSRSKSPGAHMSGQVGSDMNVVSPMAWKHFEGGCFNRSPRRTSDWIYEGVDRQLAIMQHSEGRLSAQPKDVQRRTLIQHIDKRAEMGRPGQMNTNKDIGALVSQL